GWALDSIVCTTGTSTYSTTATGATINLQPGDNVTCTFKNKRSAQDLTASKTATPALKRTWTRGIDKSVDQTKVTIPNDGSSATFNYTVAVTHNAGVDSNWGVTGKITVTNPNGFAVSGVQVSDAINDSNSSCSVSGGSTSVAANS